MLQFLEFYCGIILKLMLCYTDIALHNSIQRIVIEMRKRKLNVGIIQFESMLGDVEFNVQKASEKVKEVADKGADIVCLPELFSTGYNFNILGEKFNKLSLEFYNYTFEKMSKAAKDNGVYLIAPFSEKRNLEGIIYNSAIFFDKNGCSIGSFAKAHLWAQDRLFFKEGSELPVFDTELGKVGIAICYDIGFPETCRSLCLKGAEIIFVPAAWRIQDLDMWELNVPQRALENILFMVGVNRVGFEGDLHLFGKSKVCNPRGEIIKELKQDCELTEVVTVDLNELNTYRSQLSYLRDRHPDIYTIK